MGLGYVFLVLTPQLIMIGATCMLLWLLTNRYRYIAYFLTSLIVQQGVVYFWAYAMANGLISLLNAQHLTYFASLLSHWISPVALLVIAILIMSRQRVSTKSEAT
jgi:hypothetical protein